MKKHIDWKRVGWTIGIPCIIAFAIFVPYWVGMLYRDVQFVHDFLYFADDYGRGPWPLMAWLLGIAHVAVPLMAAGVVYIIVISVGHIIKFLWNFYYHNGEE